MKTDIFTQDIFDFDFVEVACRVHYAGRLGLTYVGRCASEIKPHCFLSNHIETYANKGHNGCLRSYRSAYNL